MDPKELSPAYFTSLASIVLGALMIGASSTLVSVLGWLLLFAGVGLNAFSVLIMVQRLKSGPLPSALTGESYPAQTEPAKDAEADITEPEPDTEAQQIIHSEAEKSSAAEDDQRIFRAPSPRPRVR